MDRIISDGEKSEVVIKASLDDEIVTQTITAKKSKRKLAPQNNVVFLDDIAD